MSPVLFGRRASDRRVPDTSDRLADNLSGSPHQCQPQQREGAVKKPDCTDFVLSQYLTQTPSIGLRHPSFKVPESDAWSVWT